jgi:hypothetical protein
MAKKRNWMGMLAAALAIGVALAACVGKKDSGGGSSGGGGGDVSVSVSVPKVGKAAPATDFTYDLSEDGKGVVIKTYTGNGGALVIPAEIENLPVVELGSSAFRGGEGDRGYNLTSVVIPASVKKIRGDAFINCERLASVTIQGSGVEIWITAFKRCTGLTKVTIQGSNTKVGIEAFGECTELSELVIPEGDNVLIPMDDERLPGWSAKNAFKGCKKLPLAMRSRLNAMGFTDI